MRDRVQSINSIRKIYKVEKTLNHFRTLTRFFLYEPRQVEFGKKSNAKHHPETKLLVFEIIHMIHPR